MGSEDNAKYFAGMLSGKIASEAEETRNDMISFLIVTTMLQLRAHEQETGENVFQVCIDATKHVLKEQLKEQLNVHHEMTQDAFGKIMGGVMGDLETIKTTSLVRINKSCGILQIAYDNMREQQ